MKADTSPQCIVTELIISKPCVLAASIENHFEKLKIYFKIWISEYTWTLSLLEYILTHSNALAQGLRHFYNHIKQ